MLDDRDDNDDDFQEGLLLNTKNIIIKDESERWLSLDEISKHLGVSKDTIRAWIKKETIPYHKIGRQYKFRLTEVNAWVESGESANADK